MAYIGNKKQLLMKKPQASVVITALLASSVFISPNDAHAGFFDNLIKGITKTDTPNAPNATKEPLPSGQGLSGLSPDGINGSCKPSGVDLGSLYARKIDPFSSPEQRAMLNCLSQCNSESCIEQRRQWWTIAKPYNGSLLECNAPECDRIPSIFRINGRGDFMDQSVLATFVQKTGKNNELCYYIGMGTSTCPGVSKAYPRVINNTTGCFLVKKGAPKEVVSGPFECPRDYKTTLRVTQKW